MFQCNYCLSFGTVSPSFHDFGRVGYLGQWEAQEVDFEVENNAEAPLVYAFAGGLPEELSLLFLYVFASTHSFFLFLSVYTPCLKSLFGVITWIILTSLSIGPRFDSGRESMHEHVPNSS